MAKNRKGRDLVGTLEGNGNFYAGDERIGTTYYSIRVERRWIETPPDFERSPAGPPRCEGTVSLDGGPESDLVGATKADRLFLELNDGRRGRVVYEGHGRIRGIDTGFL